MARRALEEGRGPFFERAPLDLEVVCQPWFRHADVDVDRRGKMGIGAFDQLSFVEVRVVVFDADSGLFPFYLLAPPCVM